MRTLSPLGTKYDSKLANGEPSAMATFLKIPNKTPPDGVAKNVFRGGKCINCKSDHLDENICFLFCKTTYHAINCFMEQAYITAYL